MLKRQRHLRIPPYIQQQLLLQRVLQGLLRWMLQRLHLQRLILLRVFQQLLLQRVLQRILRWMLQRLHLQRLILRRVLQQLLLQRFLLRWVLQRLPRRRLVKRQLLQQPGFQVHLLVCFSKFKLSSHFEDSSNEILFQMIPLKPNCSDPLLFMCY